MRLRDKVVVIIPDYVVKPGEPAVEYLGTVWGLDRLVLGW
jgi:hypothetical protein